MKTKAKLSLINSVKVFFLLSFIYLFTIIGNSQDLFVGNNTYVYARDIVLTVTNDIRLDTPSSNIFLRGDAQLYQIADVKNSDAGELSIFQNQTTNVYEYNYWCSPVGISADGIVKANVNFNGSNIRDPQDETDLTNVTSVPYLFTSAFNGTATQLSNYWIYTLKDGEGYYNWQKASNTGLIQPGYGFTLKGSPNANNVLDFRGRPNNGSIIVSCSFDGVDNQPNSGILNYAETLTGNPYPSALDLKLFLTDGPGPTYTTNNRNVLNGEIYFWEQKQKNSHYLADYEGGYSVYTPGDPSDDTDNGTYAIAAFENYNGDGSDNSNTSGNTTDFTLNNRRRFAAVGQGFLIASNVNGGNAIFDNSMRVYLTEDSSPTGDGSVFAKNNKSKNKASELKNIPMANNGIDYKAIFENPTIIPEIRLHTHINNTFYKENVIAFRESTPNNATYNKFFDGRNINELSNDAYLISSDTELVIKSINYNENTRLPLGLKASNDNTLFSIKINTLNNIPSHVNVYIFDNENNTYTDVVNNSFDITLPKGTHNNRFEVTFSKNNTTLDVDTDIFESFTVFQNNNISELKILNPKSLELSHIQLFDVSGKEIFYNKIASNETSYAYSTKSLSDGVYIAKIALKNNQTFSKKVVISNKK